VIVNVKPHIILILFSSVIAILFFAPTQLASHQSQLKYQDRGGRYEGVKGTPVSDRVDLISAVVDYKEDLSEMPAQYKLKFYLKERSSAFITVREIDNRRNYWLDRVDQKRWSVGFGNELQWPTNEVVGPLGLQLYGLGALVQLGTDEPLMEVRVAPSILYHTSAPQVVHGYLFTIKIGRRADVTCSFSRDEDNASVISTHTSEVPGQRPRTVSWDASTAREGWYRLKINVIYSNNGQEVNKVVRFYHRPCVN
jgi:hypothetical protein